MPISGASLTQGSNGSNATSYATASITPGANRLIAAWIENAKTATTPDTPTLSGNSLTWVEVATLVIDGDDRRITLFRAMGASPTTGTITISFGANTQLHCMWKIQEWDGVNTGGTNGSAAVGQTPSQVNTVNAETCTINFAAFADPNNAGVAVYVNKAGASTFTADTAGGWAELAAELNNTSPNSSMGDMWVLGDGDLSATGTFSDSTRNMGLGVEVIAAAAPVGGQPTMRRWGGVPRMGGNVGQKGIGRAWG